MDTLSIKSIKINNYRCFDQYVIDELGDQMTILIGKNGAGKTTLLNAIKIGLSFIFADTKTKKSITNGVKGVKIGQFNSLDGHYSWSERAYQYPVTISMKGKYHDTLLPDWIIQKNSESGGLLTTQYKDALVTFHNILRRDERRLPLLAFYSDSFPHIGTRMSPYAKKMLQSGRPFPREFGYYQWDADTSCSEIWESRWLDTFQNINSKQVEIANLEDQTNSYHKMIALEKDKKKLNQEQIAEWQSRLSMITSKIDDYKIKVTVWNKEKNYISDLMNRFISAEDESMPIQSIDLDYRGSKDPVIVLTFKDNSRRTFKELPAGYKRLLSIVLDISYRSFLFTSGSFEPSGIVLIDEIDLHLHPSLEQNVIDRFQKTFPNIQFIITTHSPLVISNIIVDNKNKIIVLNEDSEGNYSNYSLPNLSGVDYTTIVRDAMKVKRGSINDIQSLVDDYLYLLTEEEQSNRSEELYREIIEKYGENIALKVREKANQKRKILGL